MGMAALLKPMELMRAISSQLKPLCEANYAASILNHMWVPVCQCMGKFAQCQERKAFSKNFPLTRALLTEEATHLHLQMNGASARWKIV
jgi:hypothetical protein